MKTTSNPANSIIWFRSKWGIFPTFSFNADMDAAHHRHWPGVLKVVAGCHISLFQMPLPEDAVQLGGSMSLHGNHMTLACFHGPNFRSKSWALFHLEEPNIAFWTEAQKIWEDGEDEEKCLPLKSERKEVLTLCNVVLPHQAPKMTPHTSCRRLTSILVTTPWWRNHAVLWKVQWPPSPKSLAGATKTHPTELLL